MYHGDLLEHKDVGKGKLEVTLDLAMLYGQDEERQKFENRYAQFSELKENAGIVKEKSEDHLVYYSEQIIPQKSDDRPSVLLVFGNPASHSVASGLFFAYQGKNKEQEHRLWVALRRSGILEFQAEHMGSNNSERSELRKEALLKLTYSTPFRIGLVVYYSMPSPASEKSWGGVSGLQKLFGREALKDIRGAEKIYINQLIRTFIKEEGAVVAFQKDAWNGIKARNDRCYSRADMLHGYLTGECDCCEGVRLYCAPATRTILGTKSLESLAAIKESILNKSKA